MTIASMFHASARKIPAGRLSRRGFLVPWAAVLALLPVWLSGLIGCTPPPPADCLVAGAVGFVAEDDSLGLEEFLGLEVREQERRRTLAAQWRLRAADADRMDHRLQSLATAAGLAPDHPEVWLELAGIWRWVGDHLGAVTFLDNAAAAVRNLSPAAAEAPDASMDAFAIQEKKHDLARRIALLRAWVHYDRGEFGKGEAWIDAAARIGSREPAVLQIKGLTLGRLGRRSHALAVAEQIYRNDIFDTDNRWIRSMVEVAQGRLSEAFAYQRGLRPDREHAAECYRDMGATAERLRLWGYARRWYGQSEAALSIPHRSCLRKITSPVLDPDCAGHDLPVWLAFGHHFVTGSLSAYCAYAWASFEEADTVQEGDRWAGAVVDAAGSLIRQNIDEVWALRVRGLVFAAKEMPDRALWDLRRVDRKLEVLGRRDARVLAAMGRLHLLNEDHGRALPLLRRALELEDKAARIWSDLGLALVMTEQSTEAERALTRALELDSSLATAWYNRGLLYLHANRLEAAAADLQEAARLAPDNLEISSLLQRIRRLQRTREASPSP